MAKKATQARNKIYAEANKKFLQRQKDKKCGARREVQPKRRQEKISLKKQRP